MGEKDQKEFRDAVAKAKSAWLFEDWLPVVHALRGLAMVDMLPAVAAIKKSERFMLVRNGMWTRFSKISDFNRVQFAVIVVDNREIYDLGIPEDQVNDGREFLGCTRLDDAGVQFIISSALNRAKFAIQNGEKGTEWATLAGAANQCCGAARVAWVPILVDQRRAKPGASLISNLAAASHYMLARFHVCAAKATQLQMKAVIDGYDAKKSVKILAGDPDLKSMALTFGNRPFPPDFGIRKWAYKGAIDGDVDRKRCNSNADRPTLFPDVNGSEA